MEKMRSTDSDTRFVVWHIPTSVLLLATGMPHEAVQLVMDLLAQGIPLNHVLLQTELSGGVLGAQWFGYQLRVVLQRRDG